MTTALAFLFGTCLATLCFALGTIFRILAPTKELDLTKGVLAPGVSLFRKPQKKKPKYVSEEEQWAKEQKQVPLDPGLG